jgi:phosphomannomutase
MPLDLRALAERWIADDPDPATQDELRAVLGQPDVAETDLEDRFAGGLEFGTAGLRGVLGAGPNRMNRAVVARATWGLAQVILEAVPDAATRGVVVGADARVMSRELSEDVAAIFGAAGLPVMLFGTPVPTPLVGFTVKRMGAAAGVVITASHNPPEYNGYKVYWENAAQIAPPMDDRVSAAMNRAPPARSIARPDLAVLLALGLLTFPAEDAERAYLDAILALRVHPATGNRDLRIVYTPLHGVGDALMGRALHQAGFTSVTSVREQQEPDGAFPTVAFPNPEEPGAMDLALALARTHRAHLVLANDPDADRLAVAVPRAGLSRDYLQLTGNQVGVLLGHYLLTENDVAESASPRPRAVLASIVSSPWLGRIAGDLGVRYEETLTGFKWIANRAIELEREGYNVLFGYEEALGYCVGSAVHDKDGISAGLLMAEVAAVLDARGLTLLDALDRIARRWGVFISTQASVTRRGAGGGAAIQAMMDHLRACPPDRVGGDEVVAVTDYAARRRTVRASGQGACEAEAPIRIEAIALPPSNVLAYDLASGARIIARPSGTEPKAKFYFDVREEVRSDGHEDVTERYGDCDVARAAARAHVVLDRLVADFQAMLQFE